ncbi:MAG: putative toxin-antitoxin system toxin component, PIN family [Verrucomicrobia bacterium]|nr:putative toxin-antitoxin system toxin component, PIN family [Verrucomicrobiota bacterium]
MPILFDSNVWLAILTTDGQCRRLWRAVRGHSQIHASTDILDEIEEKLGRKFGFSQRHAHLLTHFVRRQTLPVQINHPPAAVCRDADDDRILAAAVSAGCSHLITGDHDLLVLKHFAGIAILTPREFADSLAG